MIKNKKEYFLDLFLDYLLIITFVFILILWMTYFFKPYIWMVNYYFKTMAYWKEYSNPDNFFKTDIEYISKENKINKELIREEKNIDINAYNKIKESIENINNKGKRKDIKNNQKSKNEQEDNINKKVFQTIEKADVNKNIPYYLYSKHIHTIIVNWKRGNIVYKNINNNIQNDLFENNVISSYINTPIIFSHSSWWKHNFWLSFLWLRTNDIVYLLGKKNWNNFYIKIKIKDIHKDIDWNQLNTFLSNLEYKNNHIILDTCELRWTNRRILIGEMENIVFK